MIQKIFLLFLLSSILSVDAQDLPKTNLYCATLENLHTNEWKVNKLELLNSFNFNGYNNQAFFINDDEILCSIQMASSNNTDIYKLNLKTKTFQNLINNSGKDYSPRINPGFSKGITCVHINPSDTLQNLVEYNAETGELNRNVIIGQGQIGYYRYLSGDLWICFLVDHPNNLMGLINSRTKERKIFASGIGRTFEVDEKKDIIFVHKILPDQWILKSYKTENQKMSVIATMPTGSEDFLIDTDGRIICTKDSRVLQYDPIKQIWNNLIDFGPLGLKHLGRIALKNNLLVIVDEIK